MQLQKPEINCSICHKRVALEVAKTDDVGQAVHEECYLLKLGIKRDQGSVHKARQTQTVNLTAILLQKNRYGEC
jgi:hypothetical protein